MLILIGTVPMAYALNRTPRRRRSPSSRPAPRPPPASSKSRRRATTCSAIRARPSTSYISTRTINEGTYPSLAASGARNLATGRHATARSTRCRAHAVSNVRNDMYLASEALRFLLKDKANNLKPDEVQAITAFKRSLDGATRFIPLWVKVAVAIALGLGTMIGWKRIVVTVGEKIGKTHLTYAQGASAELVAMATIGAADAYGLPVSTTHVLSSGVAGTMAANGSGLQWATVRNLLMAWVLTLPVSIVLAGGLYFIFSKVF